MSTTTAKRQWTDEQKAAIVNEALTTSPAEVMKKHGIANPQFYKWRKQFTPTPATGPASPLPMSLQMRRPDALPPVNETVMKGVPGYDAPLPTGNDKATRAGISEAAQKLITQGRAEVTEMQATVGRLYMDNAKLAREVEELKSELHAAHTFRD